MISILNQPPPFNYSKNPIVVKASTNKYLSNAGSAAVCKIGVGDYPDFDGITVEIVTDLFTQKFTFDQTSTSTATNIVFDVTVTNQVQAIAYIAKHFRKNYYISKYYNITTGTAFGADCVILTAKEKGILYNTTTTVSFSDGYGFDVPGSDPVPTGVTILVQVMQYDSSKTTNPNATEIGSRTLYPDANGVIEEDISDIIDDFLEYELNSSDLTVSRLITKSNNRYFISVSEIGVELAEDDTVNEFGIANQTDDFYTLKGGVSKSKFIDPEYNLTNEITTKTKTILSNYPDVRNIPLDQLFLLYFVNGSNTPPTYARFYAKLEDGSINDTDLGGVYITAGDGIVYQIPVKIKSNFYDYIESSSGKKIVSVFVRILNNDGAASEDIYFNIDRKHYKNFNQLILKNSKGAYEYVFCRGQFKTNIEVDYSVLDKTLPTSYTNQDFQQSRTNETHTRPMMINTGHLKSKQEKKWLADLLIKGSGFHLVNGILCPIIITNKTLSIEDSNEDIYSYDIEFVYSFINASYSL